MMLSKVKIIWFAQRCFYEGCKAVDLCRIIEEIDFSLILALAQCTGRTNALGINRHPVAVDLKMAKKSNQLLNGQVLYYPHS